MALGKVSGKVFGLVIFACTALGGVACVSSPTSIEEETKSTESALQPSCSFAIHPQVPLASSFTATSTAVDDHVSGLHWIMTPGDPTSWEEANAHCASLGARLPTRTEISNIVDYGVGGLPDVWASPFPDFGVDQPCHWASTSAGNGEHWAMGFWPVASWVTFHFPGAQCRHRCVTGAVCNPGTEKDLSSSGADEVTSKRTGLRWKKRHIGPFDDATARTACPPGWRLPTVKELLTLVDDSRLAPLQAPVWQTKTFNEMDPNGDLRFIAIGWEPNEWNSNWHVDFANGGNFTDSASALHWVRCVH